MVTLTGYKIVQKIYSSSETLVFRGIREKDQISVVIKFLRQEYPKFEKLVQFRNEYTIIKNLNIAGIIKTYGLENYENGYALVMEDFGGVSLQEKIKEWGVGGMGNSTVGLREFFTIALQIVSILQELHHQRVIHKDIKTANILINPSTLEVKLIDFSIACLLKRETQTLASPNVLEGTLSYLSPEQTGRINRLVDYRTDFYSLGVTFFELLTGELPFASNEPIELIHYHIAKQPPLLQDIHSHIPPILSAIIHKLMAKNAEYRYQSAYGIKYDLEMCLKAGEETGNIQTFELGKRDISDRLTIPEKLLNIGMDLITVESEKYAIVNKNAISVLDEVKVYKKQMLMHDMELTFDTGLKLLEKLEVTVKEVPLINVNVEDLIHLPKMTDPYKLAAMGILMGLGFIAYFSQLEMELPIILTIINLAIKYGNSVESAYTYICYGLIVCDRFSDINTGYSYGKLALNLSEQFDNQVIRFRILILWYSHIIYWKQHFRGSIVPLQEIAEYGWKIGETDFLGFAYTFNMFMMLFAGENLTTVSEYLENCAALISQRKLDWHTHNIKTWQQIIFNLRAINQDKCQFNGDFFTEDLFLFLVNNKNYHSLFGFHLTKTMQFYLFKEYKKSLDSAILSKEYITSVPGQITVSQHNFYYSLSLLAAYNYQSEHEQMESMKQVLANQQKMQYWAVNAPMNYQHKYDLIEAEKARVLGQMLLAMEYYDRAIQGANNYEYLHEEALAYELAAEFYLSLGRNEIASLYMTKAYYGYLRWGGKAKVDHLEKSYPQLLAKTLQAGKKPVSMIISKNNNISEAIDLKTVIKFSQVIASEIHIDKLLSTLMQVMIENSGASKSVLILVKNNHLFVEAVKIDNATVVQESIPVNLSKDIPINVINYVYNTAKIFVTDDIKTNLLIAADSYIVSQKPKSLLCLPIIHKSKLMGILYLENQLTVGAFTYNKIEVLNLLMTQAAISLENAQLYTNLSEQADSLKQANQQLEEYTMTLKITNRLQKLADLSLAINSTLSTNNILQLVTQQAAEIIGAHQSIISIKIDESCTKAVHTVHLADKYEQWRENYEKFDESDFYRLGCQIQNSIRMTQTELEAHPAAINNNLPLRGWLVAPLIDIKGKQIGFMHLSDKYEGDFTEDDEAILVQLAQMVLLAMNNAHLYEESQRANRIKDEFLAVLSHELRSPLTSIIGWSQMLQSGKLSPEKTAIALETIERNAKSQTQLIEDVVDISRMVRGNMRLNIQPVNLVSPIETAINTMYLAAKAKSIKILLTIASHDVMVLGDPIRLQQIVWNLLTNAIKFTSPGGQVEIGLKTVGSEAQIQVIDTGSGISPDFMPYIFDYFRQADASNTRNYGGLGLGLAIVRHLVELHGGNIWAKSLGKGQGATFTVRIPLLQSQPEPNPLSKSLNNSPNLTIDGVKVLVVDDNVDVREFLVFALEEYGAVVMTADSVREALKCLQQFPADILITDIGMPEENGYNLLDQIRSLESTQKRQIPAIALTGYTANEVIAQVLNAGFQKYLPKPIDVFELITAISQLI